MLASGSRASYTADTQTSPQRQSTTAATGSTVPAQAARLKLPKRLSLATPVTLPSLPLLPSTLADWKKTIAEVKCQYFSKRYRACSARCVEILDGIRDSSQVEPAYLICLHFYAAISMEICARPLPSTSPLRVSLLQQARYHLERAGSLIGAAEESVITRARPESVISSRASSCHSPSESVSSRAWTPDTRVSSPTDSVCSFHDLPLRSPSPPRRVKKVSFSLPRNEAIQVVAEPVIRPDSPTLGFDDSFLFSPAGVAKDEAPDPHPPHQFHEIELPLQTMPKTTEPALQQAEQDEEETQDERAFQLARSVHRCCEHLSSLAAQLARHSASLAALLSCTPPHDALDRQARIQRLRESGWQRRRFDARRYEELCDTALAELGPTP